MKTLMIKDLTVSKELDGAAMAGVTGGMGLYHMPKWAKPGYRYGQSTKIDFAADQFIGQQQDVSVVTGFNAAFVDHLKSDVTTNQNASNNINFR